MEPTDRETTDLEHYIGIRGGQIELLDSSGKVIASTEKPAEVYEIFPLAKGLYVYRRGDWKSLSQDGEGEYSEALLGPNLEELIPLGIYTGIHLGRYYQNDPPVELLLCPKLIRYEPRDIAGSILVPTNIYKTHKMIHHYDIYSMSGELIKENITRVFEATPDRIAVIQGVYGGLLDWNGYL